MSDARWCDGLPGPWTNEPDRVEWRHKGVPCLMRRGTSGGWCGYAATPPGHPWHGVDFWDLRGVEVHGGPTYSSKCAGEICHVPAAGESDDVWWIGFDSAHDGDLVPTWERIPGMGCFGGVYRTADYVKNEVERLAEQLLAVSP